MQGQHLSRSPCCPRTRRRSSASRESFCHRRARRDSPRLCAIADGRAATASAPGFQNDSPGVRVTLHDLSVQEMLDGLREGRLDAALTVASSSKQMSGLAFERLCTYPFCVAFNGSHRLARAKRVNLSQLKDERLIVYSRADYPEYYEWLKSMFQSLGACRRSPKSKTAPRASSQLSRPAAASRSSPQFCLPRRSPAHAARTSAKPNTARCGSRLSSTPSQSRRAPVHQDSECADSGSDEARRK